MKKMILIALAILVGACSSVETVQTMPDGSKVTTSMSSDEYLEVERIKANQAIVNQQADIIDKGQDRRHEAMNKPLLSMRVTGLDCSGLTNGCLIEMSQPITDELVRADAEATRSQLSAIQTIKAPTNFNDVLVSGTKVLGNIADGAKDVLLTHGGTALVVDLGKTAAKTTAAIARELAKTPNSVDNSVVNTTTTTTSTSQSGDTITAGNDLLDNASVKREHSDDVSVAIEGGVKVNSDNKTEANPNNSVNNSNSNNTTEIKEPATVEVPVVEVSDNG